MKWASYILAVSLVVATLSLSAQHTPITSQYLFNGLLINPAYAGSRDALTANLTHRQQWVGFDGAPVTQVLSVHTPVRGRKIGIGLLVLNDRIGVSRETGIITNYAYRIEFPNGKLALGIGAGLNIARSNWQDVALQQQQDVSFQTMQRSSIRPNFSSGVFYYSKKYCLGISLPFLFKQRPTIATEGVVASTRLTNIQPMIFGAYLVRLNDHLELKPSALVRHGQSSGLQGDLSANLIIREKVWIGTSYRTNDAIVGMLEVLPSPQWRIGYSYDLHTSPIQRYQGGSHEIMLQYEFGYTIRVRDPRYF